MTDDDISLPVWSLFPPLHCLRQYRSRSQIWRRILGVWWVLEWTMTSCWCHCQPWVGEKCRNVCKRIERLFITREQMENLSKDLHKLPRSPTSPRIRVHRNSRVRRVRLLGFFEKTRSFPLQLKMIEFLRFSSLLFAKGRQIQRQFLLSWRRGGYRWH